MAIPELRVCVVGDTALALLPFQAVAQEKEEGWRGGRRQRRKGEERREGEGRRGREEERGGREEGRGGEKGGDQGEEVA